jgi:hypothetical protein
MFHDYALVPCWRSLFPSHTTFLPCASAVMLQVSPSIYALHVALRTPNTPSGPAAAGRQGLPQEEVAGK